MENLYCSMIHGGLHLDFKSDLTHNQTVIQHCCLRKDKYLVRTDHDFWRNQQLESLRSVNKNNTWHPGCQNCKRLEDANIVSFRQGMNQGLNIFGNTDLSGPARIDLMFDISCNLACRTCGPESSTYWQKHLKDNGQWHKPISAPRKKNEVIQALSSLDLSNLRQLVFCGGETLLGQEYWDVADWLADHVPNAKQQLTLCFQTNGTQSIQEKNFEIIEKFHLVKLHISLDAVEDQFDYLRWPASWNQVVDNILKSKDFLPGNVMFVIEETVSIFNLYYLDRLQSWTEKNFSCNRFGDVINHTRHLATGIFNTNNLTKEYVKAMQDSRYKSLVPANWAENKDNIHQMIHNIKQFDCFRNQSFHQVFPEISKFYARFW